MRAPRQKGMPGQLRTRKSIQEQAAIAVLRQAWLEGHTCVELEKDGRRFIFLCRRCGARCYSDGALADHLQGNRHAALSVASTREKNSGTIEIDGERTIVARGSEKEQVHDDDLLSRISCRPWGADQISLVSDPASISGRLETRSESTIANGELFPGVQCARAAAVVDSSWFQWKEHDCKRGRKVGQDGGGGSGIASDDVGCWGDPWWPWPATGESERARSFHTQAEDHTLLLPQLHCSDCYATSVNVSNQSKPGCQAPRQALAPTEMRNSEGPCVEEMVDKPFSEVDVIEVRTSGRHAQNVCGREEAMSLERYCFICQQPLSLGKDEAGLQNWETRRMVCACGNKHEGSHVFHSFCLIDWISIYQVNTLPVQIGYGIDRTTQLVEIGCSAVERAREAVIERDTRSRGANFGQSCTGALSTPISTGISFDSASARSMDKLGEQALKPETTRCGLYFRHESQEGSIRSRGF